MCFNAFGLGALNIYFLIFGVLMGLMNLMPFSLDCSAGMESWMGVPGYECTSLESFLNVTWCVAVVQFCFFGAFLAWLPKLYGKEYPAKINKAVMLFMSVLFVSSSVGNLAYIHMYPITLGGVEGAGTMMMDTMFSTFLILLLVALVVHKEPSDSSKILF